MTQTERERERERQREREREVETRDIQGPMVSTPDQETSAASLS